MSDKTEEAIKNGQSRDIGNIRHMYKLNMSILNVQFSSKQVSLYN
jgi:hypothetical protein